MRVESKEVTVMKNIYISDDGKEFYDRADCLNHEFEIRKKAIEDCCFDVNGNKTDIDNCVVAYLPDDKSVEAFISVSDACGLTHEGIGKPGFYIYTDFSNNWVMIDEVIDRIKGGPTNE